MSPNSLHPLLQSSPVTAVDAVAATATSSFLAAAAAGFRPVTAAATQWLI